MPVPAGMRRPTMTFSFRPRRWSTLPLMLASVSTRVVSWNDAAEMNESVESDAFVIPKSSGRPCAGRPPLASTRSFSPLIDGEPELVGLLVDEELRVPHVLDLHPPHHLPRDHL